MRSAPQTQGAGSCLTVHIKNGGRPVHQPHCGFMGFVSLTLPSPFQAPGNIIVLTSAAGAGKTKLTSLVVQKLREDLEKRDNDEALAYFYCDRGDSARREPISILRSFLRQLAVSRKGDDICIQQCLRQIYDEKEEEGFASNNIRWDDCRRLLHELVNLYPHTVLVIDALDECNEETRGELVALLDELVNQPSRPVKVFISSRKYHDIEHRFGQGSSVDLSTIHDHNIQDITKYVNEGIQSIQRTWKAEGCPMSLDLSREIRQKLIAGSSGMQVPSLPPFPPNL